MTEISDWVPLQNSDGTTNLTYKTAPQCPSDFNASAHYSRGSMIFQSGAPAHEFGAKTLFYREGGCTSLAPPWIRQYIKYFHHYF